MTMLSPLSGFEMSLNIESQISKPNFLDFYSFNKVYYGPNRRGPSVMELSKRLLVLLISYGLILVTLVYLFF